MRSAAAWRATRQLRSATSNGEPHRYERRIGRGPGSTLPLDFQLTREFVAQRFGFLGRQHGGRLAKGCRGVTNSAFRRPKPRPPLVVAGQSYSQSAWRPRRRRHAVGRTEGKLGSHPQRWDITSRITCSWRRDLLTSPIATHCRQASVDRSHNRTLSATRY
jgi:hypothetical protein